jgi:hypothetical protein
VHVTSSTDSVDVALPVTAELRYDLVYGTHRAGPNVTVESNPAAPAGSTIDFGVYTYGLLSGTSSESGYRFITLDVNGTRGQIAGVWTLTGNADFSLYSVKATESGSFWTPPSCASVTPQSTGRCLSPQATGQTVMVNFVPSSLGVKTATLTFTPDATSGMPAQSWTLTGESRYDLVYGTHRAGPNVTVESNPAAPAGSTINFGVYAYGLLSGASTESGYRFITLDVNGTKGQIAGVWTLTGNADFSLYSVKAIESGSFWSPPSCASVAPQSTGRCLSPQVMGQTVMVNFVPSSIGVKTATLTFTPDAASGLPAQSWTLTGEGRYDLVYGTHRAGLNYNVGWNPSAPAGSTVNFGSVSSGSVYGFITLDVNGTKGQIAGVWTLSGSSDFSLYSVKATESGSFWDPPPCASVTPQLTGRCLSPQVMGQTVMVYFTPSSSGTKTATLTFTPDVASGMPAQSWALTGSKP